MLEYVLQKICVADTVFSLNSLVCACLFNMKVPVDGIKFFDGSNLSTQLTCQISLGVFL